MVPLGSFHPGVSASHGNFISVAILGTDGDVSLQALNWMLFMTFWIGSLVVNSKGATEIAAIPFGGSVARCMISGNQH